MKDRISLLAYDFAVLVTIASASFAGQVLANNIPLFGKSPVVTRIVIIEERLDALDEKVNRKIGF